MIDHQSSLCITLCDCYVLCSIRILVLWVSAHQRINSGGWGCVATCGVFDGSRRGKRPPTPTDHDSDLASFIGAYRATFGQISRPVPPLVPNTCSVVHYHDVAT